LLQKNLAKEVTSFVHGQSEYEAAVITTEKLFSGNVAENILELNESQLLESMEGVPRFNIEKSKFTAGMDTVSFLAESGIFPSKGEARKTIQGGGLSINKEKISDPASQLTTKNLLTGKYVLVQKGKKNYYLVIVE